MEQISLGQAEFFFKTEASNLGQEIPENKKFRLDTQPAEGENLIAL